MFNQEISYALDWAGLQQFRLHFYDSHDVTEAINLSATVTKSVGAQEGVRSTLSKYQPIEFYRLQVFLDSRDDV